MKCACGHYQKGKPYDLSQCRLCWLYAHDAAYRAHWDSQPPPSPEVVRGVCVYRGEDTGERLGACCGQGGIEVYECGLFGVCTERAGVGNTPCCRTCQSYSAVTPGA